MQDEPADEVPFRPPIRYVDRIPKSVLGTTLSDESSMSSSAFACALNAAQFCYLILYSVGGRNADCRGIKPAL